MAVRRTPSASLLDSDIPCQAVLISLGLWQGTPHHLPVCGDLEALPGIWQRTPLCTTPSSYSSSSISRQTRWELPWFLSLSLSLSSTASILTPSGPGAEVRSAPRVTGFLTLPKLCPPSWGISLPHCVPYSLFRIKITELNSPWAQMIEFKEQSKNSRVQKSPAVPQQILY